MPSLKRVHVEQTHDGTDQSVVGGHESARSRLSKPLRYSGLLDKYKHQDLTPVIGREFEGLQVTDLLNGSDEAIRDLAITSMSNRPFRRCSRLIASNSFATWCRLPAGPKGQSSSDEGSNASDHRSCRMCKYRKSPRSTSSYADAVQPKSSDLHVHPLTEEGSELGDQISVISSEKQKKGGGLTHQLSDVSRFASAGWHSDITFEPVPSDYAMLKIHTLPATGGDTLWASGYEIYDRLSPAMQQFLEGLTATHDAKFFLEEAERLGNPIRKGIRGNPLNFGEALSAVHPVIRTNRKLLTPL
jgi:alpha-ketoglutarate-dependent taurine dioxygenase